jgi:hypothetical protein
VASPPIDSGPASERFERTARWLRLVPAGGSARSPSTDSIGVTSAILPP